MESGAIFTIVDMLASKHIGNKFWKLRFLGCRKQIAPLGYRDILVGGIEDDIYRRMCAIGQLF